MSTAWAFFFALKRGQFFFFPSIVHTWKDCSCLSIGFVWGNLEIGFSRHCTLSIQEFNKMFTEEKPDAKEQTETV